MENLTPVRGEQISVGGRAKSNQIMDNLYIQFPVDFGLLLLVRHERATTRKKRLCCDCDGNWPTLASLLPLD